MGRSNKKSSKTQIATIALIVLLLGTCGYLVFIAFFPQYNPFSNLLSALQPTTPTTTTPTFSLTIEAVNGTDITADVTVTGWDYTSINDYSGFTELWEKTADDIDADDFEDASSDALTSVAVNVSATGYTCKWGVIYVDRANTITLYKPFTQATLGCAVLNASTGALCEGNQTTGGNVTIGMLVDYDEDYDVNYGYEFVKNYEQGKYQCLFVKFTFNGSVTTQTISFPASARPNGESGTWLRSSVNSSTEFYFYFNIDMMGAKYLTFEVENGLADVVLSTATWGYVYESGSVLYSKTGSFATSLP